MTWQVGDLAACVDSGRRTRAGEIYTLSDVSPKEPEDEGYLENPAEPLLRFAEFIYLDQSDWSGAERFRKVVSDKHEACEPEFVTLLKRIKRTVPASAMSAGTAETQSGSGLQPASAVPKADAQ